MATGWQKINGVWYYLNDDGSMVSNTWKTIDGKKYYFQPNGAWSES